MSRLATRFRLPVAFVGFAYVHPASAQPPPPGYQLLTAPQTSGGLLLTHRQAAPSAVHLLLQGSQEVVRERFERARRSQQEAHDIWWDTIQNRTRSLDRIYADWTETRRGTRVFEDTETGTRRDAPLGYSADLVRKLNRQEGRERYREIPLRDLNQ